MVAVRRKLAEHSHRRDREDRRQHAGELYRAAGIAGGDDAGDAAAPRLHQLVGDQFGARAAAETHIDDIEPAIDRLVQRIDQVAEAAAGKYFQRMDFGLRRKAANSGHGVRCGRDDAGTMRTVRHRIVGPARGITVVGEIDAARDVGELRMAVVAAGVDDADPDALPGERAGDLVELHLPLSPTDHAGIGEVREGVVQRAELQRVDAAGQPRSLDHAIPVIGERLHVDRLHRFDRAAEQGDGNLALVVGLALRREALPVHIDGGFRQRATAEADHADPDIDADTRREGKSIVEGRKSRIVGVLQQRVALNDHIRRRGGAERQAAGRIHLRDDDLAGGAGAGRERAEAARLHALDDAYVRHAVQRRENDLGRHRLDAGDRPRGDQIARRPHRDGGNDRCAWRRAAIAG